MSATAPPLRSSATLAGGADALRLWLCGTAASALTITAVDAVLLQQKKDFFTGGFLTSTYASTSGQAAAFLTASIVVDASVAGLLAALVLAASARLHLTRRARLFLVTAGALAPFVLWDIVNYSLLAYLGDAFDLGLMFELTGRSTSEMFAVASAHLMLPAALAVAASFTLLGLVWLINRFGPAGGRAPAPFSKALFARAAVLWIVGLALFVVTTRTSDVIEDGLRRKASGQLFTECVARVTDVDGDGYGIGGRTSDPAPFNAAIFPYALDTPQNGIDENAVGGDLAAGADYVEEGPSATPWRRRPDVVVFVLESFRADAVGRTVSGRPVTPTIDALARDGVASSRAFSHNGYTTQSRFHLLTGGLAGLKGSHSLIDDFRTQGYETAYFSGQDESFGGPQFSVGFERADVRYDAREDRSRRYSTFTTAGSLAVSHAVLRERIDGFLRKRDRTRPLFLYVNFHDAHFPYHHREIQPIVAGEVVGPSQIAPARREHLRAMYYNTAANVDRAIGATLELVTGATGRTPAVIVTADHGESLFDEGFLGHGYALNEAQTHIPLVVRGLPMEIVEPFGQADLRSAIGAALARDEQGGAVPRVTTDPNKVVFQYLGNIHRPRQIAFTSTGGRVIYDFRDRMVVLNDGTAAPPEALSGEAAASLQRLIHFWERIMLARAAGGTDRDESP